MKLLGGENIHNLRVDFLGNKEHHVEKKEKNGLDFNKILNFCPLKHI